MEVENKASGNSGDRFEVNMGAMMGRSKRFFFSGANICIRKSIRQCELSCSPAACAFEQHA